VEAIGNMCSEWEQLLSTWKRVRKDKRIKDKIKAKIRA
jgi:hypothetical protein